LFLNLASGVDGTDAALVSRFAADGDERAFAELVRRLGPMVLGVCRRTLGAGPDADDAYQAAFIVLARKAATLREPGQVGAWLYRVALLAARKARFLSRRRTMRELATDPLPEPLAPGLSPAPDAEEVIDEELARLPERYRAPLVLCGIRGLTTEEAARELGCPVGTVHSRLSRGRALLARQLTGRGVCGCGAAVGVTGAMTSRVSAEYVSLAVRGLTGAASRHSVQIANAVLRSLAASKFSALLGVVTCGALLFVGGLAFANPKPVPAEPPPTVPPLANVAPPTVPPLANVAAPTADPLARVRLPLLYPWLAQEVVLNDLACDKTQRDTITRSLGVLEEAVRRDFQAMTKELAEQQGNNEAVAVQRMDQECAEAFDRSVLPVLRPDQLRRLKQLTLRAQGADALLDRLVIRALAIAPEQEDQIDALLYPSSRLPGPRPSIDAEGAEQFNSRLAAGLKLLTAEQRTKWEELVGREAPGYDIAQGLRGSVIDRPLMIQFGPPRNVPTTDTEKRK
jgi:RNA polymerase sigma-70 factor (ECF subfamily)